MKLTEQDILILRTLYRFDGHEHGSGRIAVEARITTQSPSETAARHCIKLTKAGYAEKRGTRMFPTWAISEDGRAALASTEGEKR